MQKLKTVLVLLLTFGLAALFSTAALADDNNIKSGTCGDNLTWVLEDGVLTISGEGEMDSYSIYSFSSLGYAPWYDIRDAVTSIVIEDGVTSISMYAFYGCSNLMDVSIADSVTSIGYGAFYECTSLTDITIPGGVTSIGEWAFYKCNLSSITIPDSVTSVGNYAFSDTAYYNDDANWENNVLYIGNWLITAKSSLSGDYEIRSGTRGIADEAFYNRTNVTGVLVPEGVVFIGEYAFQKCSGLTSIVLPDSVTSIGYGAFRECTGLANVTLPDSLTLLDSYAFYKCSALTSIVIPDGVTWLYCTFSDCSSLTSVELPDSLTSIGYCAFDDCESLTTVDIPSSVTNIDISAFAGCTSLANITIPDSVTYIGSNAFADTLLYSNGWESGVLYIDHWLLAAESDLSGDYVIKSETVGIAANAFSGCTALTGITIPDSVVTICDSAFYGCTLLTDVVIPDSVTYVWHGAFQNCTSLANITLPQTPAWIGSEAFENTAYYNDSANWSGDALYLDNYLLRVETDATGTYTIADGTICIGYGALMDCSGVTGVSIPDTVKLIGVEAFARTGITSAVIPEGVEKMDEVAFGGCALTSLYLPRSLTWIGADMCESLEAIYYAGTEAEWAAVYIDDFWNTAFMSAPVYFLGEESGVSVPGDLNGDGEVNASDLMILARHVGKVEYITDETALAN
ncbi:MAG: leucine-rich repeat protein, partial [Oscillospiraceae bacterium]|nr:leucine-rich repeat protein [Oscillospiraceae bacterium]